jgi:hypothetical protein
MPVGLELCKKFVEEDHFTRVHHESSSRLVVGLVAVLGTLEEVRVVPASQPISRRKPAGLTMPF